MSRPEPRPLLGLVGALLFWGGLCFSILFGAVGVWLLATGSQPSWILLAVTAGVCLAGLGVVKWSGVPLSEAMLL
ncbi:hypothetical protein GCM10010458_16140 [Microbacterium luteolum]|uniref:Uncharacterized protein n=1 Tax=Microbacterium luteolum TaxID=69367 RepID=A0ABY7XQJ0_MICLT|nr:hypothetical protein [Microbacterium luteolum]WDM44322.1 hypothetical protein KV395_14175 [Microbacterium luteolum]